MCLVWFYIKARKNVSEKLAAAAVAAATAEVFCSEGYCSGK
jgi:hypothetical protein